MKSILCDYEDVVAKAARHGGLDESLDESLGESLGAHLDSCEHCREIAAATGWMATLAGDARSDPALPDPGLIWLRARIEEIQQADERAQRPLEIAHVATLVVGAVGAVGLLVWEGSPLRDLWPKLQINLAAGPFGLTSIDFASPAVSTVAFGLLVFALLLLLRSLVAED